MDFVRKFRMRDRSDDHAAEWEGVLDDVLSDERFAARAAKAADGLTDAEASVYYGELVTACTSYGMAHCDLVAEGRSCIKMAALLFTPVIGAAQDVARLSFNSGALDRVVNSLPPRDKFPYFEGCYFPGLSLDPNLLLKTVTSSLGAFATACDAMRDNGPSSSFDDTHGVFGAIHQRSDLGRIAREQPRRVVYRLMPFVQWHAVPSSKLRMMPDTKLLPTPDAYQSWAKPTRALTGCHFLPPMPLLDAASYGFAAMASHSLAGLHASGKAQPGETLRLTDVGSNRGKGLATLRTASGHPVAPVHPLLFRMAGPERARYLETALGSRITFGAERTLEDESSVPKI